MELIESIKGNQLWMYHTSSRLWETATHAKFFSMFLFSHSRCNGRVCTHAKTDTNASNGD